MTPDKLDGPEEWCDLQRKARQYNFPWGIVLRALGIGAVLVLLLGMVGFGLRWAGGLLDVVGPENVKQQWRFAYDTIEDLEGIASQVCLAEGRIDEAESQNEREQRRTQLAAREDNYQRVAQDYDGRVRDAFRAGLVKPPDVPDRAPMLEEMKKRMCG